MKRKTFVLELILLVLVFSVISCKSEKSYAVKENVKLSEGWTFKMKGDTQWLPAKVPGCVHTDLLMNNKIPQPFYRDNEKLLQWIDKKDWMYRCSFNLDSAHMMHNQILLHFNGLDTYAEVKLNGKLLFNADNMFREWAKEVKDILVEGTNILEIEFTSPVRVGLQKLDDLGYGLPAVNDQSEVGGLDNKKVSVFTRKAPYHYGWDWGPRFVTSGVWRPVELVFYDLAKINNVYFKQSQVDETEAIIDAEVEVEAVATGQYQIDITNGNETPPMASTKIELEQGTNSVTLPFRIANPQLWWPNGMGDHHLYQFRTKLVKNNIILDTISYLIGLRSVRLIRNPDSLGQSFYFEVNGKPLFAKGANYIPNDNFLSLVTEEKYKKIIQSAVKSNMNMLRVWGGGIYENNLFYDLCDKAGILLWQDFMFACSMYPGDEAFLTNVRQELINNVKRLRNHASIALWCGNNEIDVAWCEGDMHCGWGWKQKYTSRQRKAIWHSYDTLFYTIIPDIIDAYDQTRAYWPSSPQADWGVHSTYTSTMGDMHYWGVWHGNEPFSAYYATIGRFMSEYGFQSFPAMTSIKKFTLPHDWNIDLEVMQAHQRSGYGNSRIIDYMKKMYPVPNDFESILYVSQVMQAEAIKSAILAHRAHKPYCMGSLFWQINDCWPAASWSSIDYYGSWKALQYFAVKAFAPVAISFFPEKNDVRIFLDSDLPESREVKVEYSLIDFNGNVITSKLLQATLDPERATAAFTLSLKDIKELADLSKTFLLVRLMDENNVLASDSYFFVNPKELYLPKANINTKLRIENGKLLVDLTTDKLAKNVYLSIDNIDADFSDNYFDLLPGESKIVTLEVAYTEKILESDLKIQTLNTLINPNI
jgi:beta-mannosidase